MAREIVAWCDIDLGERDERVPGQTYPVDVGGGQRLLDLCEAHRKELLGPLVEAVQNYGTKPDGPPRSQPGTRRSDALDTLVTMAESGTRRGQKPAGGSRAHQCPFCPLDYTGATSLLGHIRKLHGFGPKATTVDVFGRICPLCNAGGYSVLAQHALHNHELSSTAALFAAAKEAGDEFGIVAERVGLAEGVRE